MVKFPIENDSDSSEDVLLLNYISDKSKLINDDSKQASYNTQHKLQENNEKENKFPKSVFFIIGNEFCERFSYYGLRTVLSLYLANELLLSEDTATLVYHFWAFLCYLTPLVGASIADSWLGRYKTILIISIVYLIGNVVLSLAATTPLMRTLTSKTATSAIGLLLIAFGTGGIKPCVSAFGGDQFKLPEQEHFISRFFSIFYFSINAGALLSTFITPILREDVSCFGGDCYALAFGVPAGLMMIALGIFLIGSPKYRIVPPFGNIIGDVFCCIFHAGRKKLFSREKVNHWLDLAKDKYNPDLIKDIKILLRVFVLFLPLPFFWALYEQQGSRWTFQATKMDGKVGSVTIKPDQIQIFNPVLVLVLIPLFDAWIYPALTKFNLLTNPLKRMLVGGFIASIAFILSAIVQMEIESTPTPNEPPGNVVVILLNPTDCDMDIESPLLHHAQRIYAHERIIKSIKGPEDDSLNLTFSLIPVLKNTECPGESLQEIVMLDKTKRNLFIISSELGNMKLTYLLDDFPTKRDEAAVRIIDSSGTMRMSLNVNLIGEDGQKETFVGEKYTKGFSYSKPRHIRDGNYIVQLSKVFNNDTRNISPVTLDRGSYSFIFIGFNNFVKNKENPNIVMMSLLGSTLHILWLIPQFVLISIGEVMFSVPGLEFSFTQAPNSMKSVIQATWLLTNAIGNMIVTVTVSFNMFSKQSLEFFLFSALMFFDMLFFMFLAHRFTKQQKERDKYLIENETLPADDDRDIHSSTDQASL